MALNFPSSPTNGQTYTANNITWEYETSSTTWKVKYEDTVGVGKTKVAVLRDQKNYDKGGGYFYGDYWRDRDLTVIEDPQSFVTFVPTPNGQTTESLGKTPGYWSLPAGTYEIQWGAFGGDVNRHQTRLVWSTTQSDMTWTAVEPNYSTTTADNPPDQTSRFGTNECFGSSENVTHQDQATWTGTWSKGTKVITITQTTYFKVLHISEIDDSEGFGTEVDSSAFSPDRYTTGKNIYAEVRITDLSTAVKEGTDGSVLNVKDYGALGDGSTNDTTAIQAAFDAANSTAHQKGKRIVFPAGVYCVQSQLNVTLDAVQEQFHVEGLGNVVIRQKHANNGFNIDIDTNDWLESLGAPRVTIRGITFAQDDSLNNSQGKAIYLDGANAPGQHTGICIIENCRVSNYSNRLKSFSMGIHINDLHDVSITNCSFHMDFGDADSPKKDSLNTAIYIDGTTAAYPAHYYVDNCSFFYGNAGIHLKQYCEGLYVSNCGFVVNDNGIICDVEGELGQQEPGLQVTNCHFNQATTQYDTYSIYGNGMVDVLISNNLIYAGPNNNGDGSSGWTGLGNGERGAIYLEHSGSYTITNNVFKRNGSHTPGALQLISAIKIGDSYASGATALNLGTIQSNIFELFDTARRAVYLMPESEYVSVVNNQFKKCNGDIKDDGTAEKNLTFPQLNSGDAGDPVVTVWNAVKTGTQTITGTNWTEVSSLTQDVTALSPTSKFLITVVCNAATDNSGSSYEFDSLARLVRTTGGVDAVIGSGSADTDGFGQSGGQIGYYEIQSMNLTYLDTPGVGTHTYHVMGRATNNSHNMLINTRGAGTFQTYSQMTIQQVS